MKFSVLTLFVMFMFTSASTQECDYLKNEKSQYDGAVTQELKGNVIWQKIDKGLPDRSRYIFISLRREDDAKFVKFKEIGGAGYWGSSFRDKIIKVKLEDGNVVIFKNWDGSQSTTLDEEGKLLPNEIKILKASPIEVIRIDMPKVYTHDDIKFFDLIITGEAKYYFINNLDCIE